MADPAPTDPAADTPGHPSGPASGPGQGPASASRPQRPARRRQQGRPGATRPADPAKRRQAARKAKADDTKHDSRQRLVLNISLGSAVLLLLVNAVAAVGLLPFLDVTPQILLLSLAAVLLSLSSHVFPLIDWPALRKLHGAIDHGRGQVILTTASILVLVSAVALGILDLVALLVFSGALQLDALGITVARNFILLETAVLLVYVFVILARQQHGSKMQPGRRAYQVSWGLTSVAALFVVGGVLVALGLPQRLGLAAGVRPDQGVYILTFGVLLDFLAMRVRMRLPGVLHLAVQSIDQARRAGERGSARLRKSAARTYIASFLFVALSMGFVAAIATGSVGLGGSRAIAVVVLYAGLALVFLGLVAVRALQAWQLRRKEERDELEELAARRPRSPEETFRLALMSAGWIVAAAAGLMAILTGAGFMPWHTRFATDWGIVGLLAVAGPYAVVFNQRLRRRAELDRSFPELLRDLAESARVGITLPRALVVASGGDYGHLSPEVKRMAKEVQWGVPFGRALERFAERADTPLIRRSVNLVVEAQRAGGNVVDVLSAAASDAQELHQIVEERQAQMGLYRVVTAIAFFVFIAVVLVLSSQFLPAFKEAVGGSAQGQQVGGLNFRDFEIDDFNTLFLHAAVIQAVGGGLVGGLLARGHPAAGLGQVVVLTMVAWFSFRVLTGVLA
ncbi:MAG: type II secretion system F family protein [Thermoplasmatota archaeon]